MNSPELGEAISMVRLSPIQLDSLWFLDFLRYVCSSLGVEYETGIHLGLLN